MINGYHKCLHACIDRETCLYSFWSVLPERLFLYRKSYCHPSIDQFLYCYIKNNHFPCYTDEVWEVLDPPGPPPPPHIKLTPFVEPDLFGLSHFNTGAWAAMFTRDVATPYPQNSVQISSFWSVVLVRYGICVLKRNNKKCGHLGKYFFVC